MASLVTPRQRRNTKEAPGQGVVPAAAACDVPVVVSAKHQKAFNHLLYGIRERKGFIELTGEVGAGKTTICRKLLEELGPNYRTALILNPCLSSHQLIKTIALEFGLKARGIDRVAYLQAINDFVLKEVKNRNDVVLVIDEAQDLRAGVPCSKRG